MKRTLILSTTSYAGMGPYVSEIVNQFSTQDNTHDKCEGLDFKNISKLYLLTVFREKM